MQYTNFVSERGVIKYFSQTNSTYLSAQTCWASVPQSNVIMIPAGISTLNQR